MYPSFTPHTERFDRRGPAFQVCLNVLFYSFIGITMATMLLLRWVSRWRRIACCSKMPLADPPEMNAMNAVAGKRRRSRRDARIAGTGVVRPAEIPSCFSNEHQATR
jgi:hypothetical protein